MRPGINRIIFLFIVLAGLLLRLWGIGFGLPFSFHQDEPVVVNHALAYGTGDLNPHFFAIPPLTSYLLFIIYGILFILGKFAGAWTGAEDFAVQFFKDPAAFYLVGRFFIGVLPGMLCIVFTYQLAKKLMSARAALYSSAITAFSFLNVINSHYIYTDMLLVMFVILAYMAIFSCFEKPTIKNYLIAGVVIGLATGTKYNAVLLAVPYLLVHFAVSYRNKEEWRSMIFSGKLWTGFLSAAVTVLLVNPFMVLDFPGFLNSFTKQAGAFWHTGWKHHLAYSLFQGISTPLVLAGIVGLLVFCFRKRTWGLIFISFPILLYVFMVFKSQPFPRYVLPLVPFLSVGASYFILEYLYGLFSFPLFRKLVVLAAICWLVPTGAKAVKADILFSAQDTRIDAADWIKKNLAPGTKIACDSTNFRPALEQPYSQLKEKREFLKKQPGMEDLKSKKLELMMKAADKEDKGYPLYFLFDDPASEGQFLGAVPAIPYDIRSLREKGIEYVVINGQLESGKKDEFIRQLERYGKVVRDFSPYMDGVFKESIDKTATTCLPAYGGDLFSRRSMGPSLRIYEIK